MRMEEMYSVLLLLVVNVGRKSYQTFVNLWNELIWNLLGSGSYQLFAYAILPEVSQSWLMKSVR